MVCGARFRAALRHYRGVDAAVRSLRCPLLLLHAEEDEVVPFGLSERLVEVAPDGLCRFVAVPGGHHRSIQHDAEFQELSVRFLLESFGR